MKLSVIIPVYNERNTIEAVVRRVQAVNLGPVEKEIIVVDDGSRDGTTEILKELSGIRRISHEKNAGKGAALTTGFRAATGDIVLIQDADLEYDPADYRAMIRQSWKGAVTWSWARALSSIIRSSSANVGRRISPTTSATYLSPPSQICYTESGSRTTKVTTKPSAGAWSPQRPSRRKPSNSTMSCSAS